MLVDRQPRRRTTARPAASTSTSSRSACPYESAYDVVDQLGGGTFRWHGALRTTSTSTPASPAHVFRVEASRWLATVGRPSDAGDGRRSQTASDRQRAATARRRSAGLVPGRDHLRAPRPRLRRLQRRRHRRLRRARRPSSTTSHDLGVTAIWLLPFYPSPLRDDGYDIADYRTVDPDYGDLRQFRRFVDAAHERGIRVITELVLNHTSDQHPWFQRARRAPAGSPWRDFYVWSDTPDRYADARIIFQDFETSNWTWDPVAERVLLAPLLQPPARPQLRQPRRRGRACSTCSTSGWTSASTACASTPCRTCSSARARTARTCPRRTTFLKRLRTHVDAQLRRTACCSPRPTSGRRTPPPTSATATSAT